MTESPLFSIANLRFHYPSTQGKSNGTVAVDFTGNQFLIPQGCRTILLGPSGCGKSTLLQICGLLRNASLAKGNLVYNSTIDFAELTVDSRLELQRNSFGFILQTFFLLPNFTMVENVAMPLIFQGVEKLEALKRARELICGSGLSGSGENDLEHNLDKTSDQLSQGQKQRTAILRALIHSPQVIFADELTSNLDYMTIQKTFDLLNRWQKEGGQNGCSRSLLMVTHDHEVASSLGEHFVIMNSRHQLQKSISRDDLPKGSDLTKELRLLSQAE